MKDMGTVYAELIIQYEFKNQLTFLLFKKDGEDKEIISEKELPNTLSITNTLTQSELYEIIIHWTLENRIQSVEMMESGCIFQRITTMGVALYKSGELKSSSYVKLPLRSSDLINIIIDDKYCFIWSIIANLHPCYTKPYRTSNYEHFFNE